MTEVTRTSRLLDAVVALSADLSLPNVLKRIVEAAAAVSGARYAALGVLAQDQPDLKRGLVEFVTHGIDSRGIRAIGHLPQGLGILGLLITDPKPRRIADIGAHPAHAGFPAHHPPMTSFLGVPVMVRDQVFGNLYLTEKQGAAEFSQSDEDMVVALAGAAGVAIENARLHQRLEQLAVLGERERIARDLHDTVIQRLFATGMGLQSLVGRMEESDLRERLQQAVDELDETIREIRITIFDLEARDAEKDGLRARVLSLTGEATATLGFAPKVHMDGPLDAATDADHPGGAPQDPPGGPLQRRPARQREQRRGPPPRRLGNDHPPRGGQRRGAPEGRSARARPRQHADAGGVAGGRLRAQRAPRRRDGRHLAGSSLALRGGAGRARIRSARWRGRGAPVAVASGASSADAVKRAGPLA
jgi:signal transduction histidine kinase